jgi:hypothetical protein
LTVVTALLASAASSTALAASLDEVTAPLASLLLLTASPAIFVAVTAPAAIWSTSTALASMSPAATVVLPASAPALLIWARVWLWAAAANAAACWPSSVSASTPPAAPCAILGGLAFEVVAEQAARGPRRELGEHDRVVGELGGGHRLRAELRGADRAVRDVAGGDRALGGERSGVADVGNRMGVSEIGLAGLQRLDLVLGLLQVAAQVGLDGRHAVGRLTRIDQTGHAG